MVCLARMGSTRLRLWRLTTYVVCAVARMPEVGRWALFGRRARMQGCVFVDRQVRSTTEQRDAIAERLAQDEALILFPEGTSHDGNRVLPFKSSLFGAVAIRGTDAP